MQWTETFKELGIAAALVTAISSLVLAVVNYRFNRRLADQKESHETELQHLKGAQDLALLDFKTRSDNGLEHVRTALARAERIESDIVRSRGEAYGEIWSLTGSVSLFGPTKSISASDLSGKFSNWYFADGWLLTQDSKTRYFLIQEVLSFLILHSWSFRRPAEEILFGDPSHPTDALREIRRSELGIENRGEKGSYTLEELQNCVAAWRFQRLSGARESTSPEQAWILLQFIMSAFRSHLVKELKSGEVFPGPTVERP